MCHLLVTNYGHDPIVGILRYSGSQLLLELQAQVVTAQAIHILVLLKLMQVVAVVHQIKMQ